MKPTSAPHPLVTCFLCVALTSLLGACTLLESTDDLVGEELSFGSCEAYYAANTSATLCSLADQGEVFLDLATETVPMRLVRDTLICDNNGDLLLGDVLLGSCEFYEDTTIACEYFCINPSAFIDDDGQCDAGLCPAQITLPNMMAPTASPVCVPCDDCGDGACSSQEAAEGTCALDCDGVGGPCGDSGEICTADQRCITGLDDDDFCTDPCPVGLAPGESFCFDDVVVECDPEGFAVPITLCVSPETCSPVGDDGAMAACRQDNTVCTNGERRCKLGVTDIVEECQDGVWSDVLDCDKMSNDPSPTPGAMLGPRALCFDDLSTTPSTAGCYPEGSRDCDPSEMGQTACNPQNNSLVQACDGRAWVDTTDCRIPRAENGMVVSRCVNLEPGMTRCVPLNRQICTMSDPMIQCDTDADPFVRYACQDGLYIPVENCADNDVGIRQTGVCNNADPNACGSAMDGDVLPNCAAAEAGNRRCRGDRIEECQILSATLNKWVTLEHCALPTGGPDRPFHTCVEDTMGGTPPTCVPVGSTPCPMGAEQTCDAMDRDLINRCEMNGFQRPAVNCHIDIMFGQECNTTTSMCAPPMMGGGTPP